MFPRVLTRMEAAWCGNLLRIFSASGLVVLLSRFDCLVGSQSLTLAWYSCMSFIAQVRLVWRRMLLIKSTFSFNNGLHRFHRANGVNRKNRYHGQHRLQRLHCCNSFHLFHRLNCFNSFHGLNCLYR